MDSERKRPVNGPCAAEAHVVAFSDGIAANWNILEMARENGRWIVKRDIPNDVS
jgi:hypothetical protein